MLQHLREYNKLVYRFYLSKRPSVITEKAGLGFLILYELQYASVFVDNSTTTSPFDSPILRVISLTRLLGIFGLKSLTNLIIFTVIFGLIVLLETIWIFKYIKKRTISERAQKANTIVFMIQKHVLLIPALIVAANNIVKDRPLESRLLACAILVLACGYNVFRARFKVALPYSKPAYSNTSGVEEGFNLVILLIAVFMMRLQVNGSFSQASTIAFSIIYLIITLLKVSKSLILPQFVEQKCQRLHILMHFASFYTLVVNILAQFTISRGLPSLLVISFIAKIFVNGKTMLLELLYKNLKKISSKRNIKDLALKSLYLHFTALRKPNYEMIRIMQTILENSLSEDIFNSDMPIETSEYPLKTYLKPKVLKFIEEQYASIIVNTTSTDSYQIRLSQIQFLAVACQNPMKAMICICETKKALNGSLYTAEHVTLEVLQDNFHSEFRSEVSLDEILKIHNTYDNLLKKTENLVTSRAQLFYKLAEPACDLSAIKSLALNFSRDADKILNEIRRQIKEDCIHLGTLNLYEYIKTFLYEQSVEFEITMFQEALIRSRNFYEDESMCPDRKVFANIDADASLFYMAFSLDQKRVGQGVACSSNTHKVLGISPNVAFSKLNLEDIFPNFFVQRLREVVMEFVEPSSTHRRDFWCKVWLSQAGGSICEAKAFLSVDLLFQSELAVVFYVYPSTKTSNYVLCDARDLALAGFSDGLLETIRKITNTSQKELPAKLMDGLKIQEMIPGLEAALSKNTTKSFEFNGTIQFEKVASLMTSPKKQTTGKATPRNHVKTSPINILKADSKLIAKYAVSFDELEIFNINYCRITINHVQERVNRSSMGSTRLPLISHDQQLSAQNLPVNDGLTKLAPVSCELIPLDLTGADDKSENSVSNDAKLLEWGLNPGEISSKTTHRIVANRNEERFERDSSLGTSSRLSNRRRRMKQLISKLDVPYFLMAVNVMGHISVLGLVILAIASSVVLSQGYDRFSKFATVAPFPSYLTSVVKSISGTTELSVGVNRGLYPPSMGPSLAVTLAANFQQKIQRFTETYNEEMVDFNVLSISPNFKWSDYDISITRQGMEETPTSVSIYDASKLFMGVAWKLSRTKFTDLTANLSETSWLRQHSDSLINTYERMRVTLFSDFYLQYDSIMDLFDMVLIIGVAVTLYIVLVFVLVIKAIEKRKFDLMKQLLTIPTGLIDSNLKRLHADYEACFGVRLQDRCVEIQALIPDQAKKKSSSAGKQSTTIKRKIAKTIHTPLLSILICMLVPMTYILSYYAIANIYFKHKTSLTIPFIKNIDLLSSAVHYPGYALGLMMSHYNQYDNPAALNDTTILDRVMNRYKEINTAIVGMMQSVKDTLLSNSEATDTLKERYHNISGILVCDDMITYPNYKACHTSFNNAAELGFAATFQKLYEYIVSIYTKFTTTPTFETAFAISQSSLVGDRTAISIEIDNTVVLNMEIAGANLSAIMSKLQWNLTIFMIVGILQMSSLLFFIWRPFNRRITRQYLDCRLVFAILPIDMIVDNKSILYILKKQDNTQCGV